MSASPLRDRRHPLAAPNTPNRAAGLLPFWPDPFPFFAPSLWRKIPSSFVSKSALFRASRALADSQGRWDLCPVPAPGPKLCQEGTQISGGGREPHLPSPITKAVTKGSLWNASLGMKGEHISHSAGPGRELAGDTYGL